MQFNISFAPYLIWCAGPSGSLIVRFYRESNHLSHSCDKPALETLKCQVVFITSTAGLRLNLSLVYVTTLPLLAAKCETTVYMLMELSCPLVLQFHLYYPSPVSEQGNGAYYSPLDAHPIRLQWRIHPPCV